VAVIPKWGTRSAARDTARSIAAPTVTLAARDSDHTLDA